MTPTFLRFVRPAEARPQLWRLVAGLVVASAVYIATAAAILGAAWWLLARGTDPMAWMQATVAARTPGATLILLATFAGMALGAIAAARLLHRRGAGTLVGPGARTLRDFAIAAGLTLVVLSISLGVWSLSYDAVPNLGWGPWLALLPLTLAGLAVQTGAEELLFRGYLQSQLAARFRSPLAWLVLPGLLFGLVHYDPATAGDNAWMVVAGAALFGLLAADLTAQTGSIGAAWGMHFANNTLAIAVVATDGTITGLARYVTPYAIDEIAGAEGLIAVDLAVILLAWWLVRRAVAR